MKATDGIKQYILDILYLTDGRADYGNIIFHLKFRYGKIIDEEIVQYKIQKLLDMMIEENLIRQFPWEDWSGNPITCYGVTQDA